MNRYPFTDIPILFSLGIIFFINLVAKLSAELALFFSCRYPVSMNWLIGDWLGSGGGGGEVAGNGSGRGGKPWFIGKTYWWEDGWNICENCGDIISWRGGGISGCQFGIVSSCGCNGAGDWITFSSVVVEGAGSSVSAIDCCSFSGEFLGSTFAGGWIGSLALMGVDDAMSKSIGFFLSLNIWRIISCLRARSWKN